MDLMPNNPSLPILQPQAVVKNYSPAIIEVCENLYYRQSMINDYLTCPNLMLYKWIIGHTEDDTFFAAILGTAGHSVIEEIHLTKRFETSYMDMLTIFIAQVQVALASSEVPPRIAAKYATISAQCNAVAPEYVQMIQGYCEDPENQKFHCTVIEQKFALEIKDEFGRTFIFTGTIDQGGFYGDGSFALRDIKFRADAFRPGKFQIALDLQLSLYAYALRYGNPCCEVCKPAYAMDGTLTYTGPCDTCKAKIGTSAWPRLVAERTELIWMRDYTKRGKDEYAKFDTSDTEKEYNPVTKRMNKKKVLNEKWVHGYKKGDRKGPGRILTERSEAFLQVHIADILRVCGMIRDGRFYRKSGPHCNMWCKFREPCMQMVEQDVEEIDVANMNDHMATIDPFGGD